MTTSRKICRSGSPCQPDTLKQALDCLGHHGVLTVRELAEQLSQYDEDNYPPVRQIVPLTLASQNDAVLIYLAQTVGGVFFRLPAAGAQADVVAIGQMVREFGELLEEVSTATADGRVTEEEVARVRHEANDVMTAIVAYVEHLQRQITQAPIAKMRRRHSAEGWVITGEVDQ